MQINFLQETSLESLKDFRFWGGAKDWVSTLTDEQWNILDNYIGDLAECLNEPLTDTFINDTVWFDDESHTLLGYGD
ncbi:hypothetical protein [Campylobacter hyointestinalis]|uniref:hypothetical protein n=1 Tax=Campylobacter hyointestinalis TaxID=198 RepID=UPI0007252F72|nr:hypothetical protein [Campylobacter hyointestinalis]CUU77566.1 Uncharacterised protein [Campylobacter hyointestinalis subsp. hyointestinalis]